MWTWCERLLSQRIPRRSSGLCQPARPFDELADGYLGAVRLSPHSPKAIRFLGCLRPPAAHAFREAASRRAGLLGRSAFAVRAARAFLTRSRSVGISGLRFVVVLKGAWLRILCSLTRALTRRDARSVDEFDPLMWLQTSPLGVPVYFKRVFPLPLLLGSLPSLVDFRIESLREIRISRHGIHDILGKFFNPRFLPSPDHILPDIPFREVAVFNKIVERERSLWVRIRCESRFTFRVAGRNGERRLRRTALGRELRRPTL